MALVKCDDCGALWNLKIKLSSDEDLEEWYRKNTPIGYPFPAKECFLCYKKRIETHGHEA